MTDQDDKKEKTMKNLKIKLFMWRLENRFWKFFRPVFILNQMYQRQTFGRMTSVSALTMELSHGGIQGRKPIK